MISQLILTAIFTLTAFQPPLKAQTKTVPFTSQATLITTNRTHTPAKIVAVKDSSSNEKIIINWLVEENQSANLFEVEKSNDGKKFKLAAIVFGTDKPATGNYQFYEKKSSRKTLYRIKVVNKNGETSYSGIIKINPTD